MRSRRGAIQIYVYLYLYLTSCEEVGNLTSQLHTTSQLHVLAGICLRSRNYANTRTHTHARISLKIAAFAQFGKAVFAVAYWIILLHCTMLGYTTGSIVYKAYSGRRTVGDEMARQLQVNGVCIYQVSCTSMTRSVLSRHASTTLSRWSTFVLYSHRDNYSVQCLAIQRGICYQNVCPSVCPSNS